MMEYVYMVTCKQVNNHLLQPVIYHLHVYLKIYPKKLHCSWTCVEIIDYDTIEVMLSLNDKVPTMEAYVEKLDLDYETSSQVHLAYFTINFAQMLDLDVDSVKFNNSNYSMDVNPSFVQCTPKFETVAPTRGLQFIHRQW